MNIYIEYLNNIYIIPTSTNETYEMAYERAWWIAKKEPKTIEEFNKIIDDSFIWSYEKFYGISY
jgi:hypothetical protein